MGMDDFPKTLIEFETLFSSEKRCVDYLSRSNQAVRVKQLEDEIIANDKSPAPTKL
jgi:hypothetical protein